MSNFESSSPRLVSWVKDPIFMDPRAERDEVCLNTVLEVRLPTLGAYMRDDFSEVLAVIELQNLATFWGFILRRLPLVLVRLV